MQQWIFQVGGLVLDIIGFLLIVREWQVSHDEAERAIARAELRSYAAYLPQYGDERQR